MSSCSVADECTPSFWVWIVDGLIISAWANDESQARRFEEMLERKADLTLFDRPPHALAAAQAENKRLRELIERAEELLFCAMGALSKMGLRDRGSDCGLSHEVRMFALQFSQEGREGPGALQVTGTGDLHRWTQDARAALSTPADTAELDRLVADAGRYRMLRRGQRWSVINGIGDTLRGDQLDAAIDAARAEVKS